MVLTLEEGHYYNFHDVGFVTYKIYSFFFFTVVTVIIFYLVSPVTTKSIKHC